MRSNIAAHGRVDAFTVSPDGLRTQVVHGSNTLLYSCADAVAHVFAGVPDRRPATIGFVYGDTDSLWTSFPFTQGDRSTRTQAEIVGPGLQVYETYIDQNRRFSSSGAAYSGNVVTFAASKPGSDVPSYVYGVLLKDAAGNVLAVKRFDECVMQSSGYAFAAEWTVTFN